MDSSPAPPTFETIRVTVDGERGALQLHRPDQLNPLSTQTLHEIEDAARWLDRRPQLKVVVVSGAGRAMSAGADLGGFGDSSGRTGGTAAADRDAREQGGRMARAVEEIRAVTVAQIHGWCVGGGFVLASACDLRVAAASTRFLIPEVDLGIPLTWGAIPRMVRDIGPALTKELVMTCRSFEADEARVIGFLNRVVPDDRLDDEVAALVDTLVGKARYALLATKAHVNAVTESMVGVGRSWADPDALAAGFNDPEGRSKAREYLERRRR